MEEWEGSFSHLVPRNTLMKKAKSEQTKYHELLGSVKHDELP